MVAKAATKWIFLVLASQLICAHLAAAQWDETGSLYWASTSSKLAWPGKGFYNFINDDKHLKFAPLNIPDTDKARQIKVDVSLARMSSQLDFLLSAPKGSVDLFTKEKDPILAPTLLISTDGKTTSVPASLDSYFHKSTRSSLGRKPTLKAGAGHYAMISFSLPPELMESRPDSVSLVLNTTNRQFGVTTLQVTQLLFPQSVDIVDDNGIARLYPMDKNIGQDKRVFYADNFEEKPLFDRIKTKIGMQEPVWQNVANLNLVSHRQAQHFITSPGRSGVANFLTTKNLALNFDYYFKQQIGYEPEEAYFRYYMKVSDKARVSGGGKLPGFSGTYNSAGWGGRRNDGKNGWSARGAFFRSSSIEQANVLPIGSYLYEVSQHHKYGQTIPWGHRLSALNSNQWYSIEQRIKLNDPGKNNGILEAWIDGVRVYRKDKLNVRSIDDLKIEKVWFNFYFGGTDKPTQDFDLYIDNIVIARSYIGPIAR